MLYKKILMYGIGLLLVGISGLMTWATMQVNVHYLWLFSTALSGVADIVVLTPWAVQLIRYHLLGKKNIRLWTMKEACKNWGAVFIALYAALCVVGFIWFGYSYLASGSEPKSLFNFLQLLANNNH